MQPYSGDNEFIEFTVVIEASQYGFYLRIVCPQQVCFSLVNLFIHPLLWHLKVNVPESDTFSTSWSPQGFRRLWPVLSMELKFPNLFERWLFRRLCMYILESGMKDKGRVNIVYCIRLYYIIYDIIIIYPYYTIIEYSVVNVIVDEDDASVGCAT